MLSRVVVASVFLIFCSCAVTGKSLYKSGLKNCYKEECPEDTFACEKVSEVSNNKKNIETEIRCLGLNGSVLRTKNITEANPFGPTLHYQSYSYTGSFSISKINDADNDSNSSDSDKRVDNEVDTSVIEKTSKRPSKTYAEIDDLNSANHF